MADEQLDYGDEEFGASQKMRYHGDGAIPALADDEIGGEDDEYDDLYNDVNVGENFLQMQRAESLPSVNVGNGKFHDQKSNFQEAQPEAQPEPVVSQEKNIPGVAAETVYPSTSLNKEGLTVDLSQQRMAPEVSNDMGFHGAQKPSVEPISGPIGNEHGPMLNSNPGHGPGGGPPMPGHQMGGNQVRPPVDNGATTLFVGELHWWTTDAELENVLSHYGRVKEIKFFDERASGKSKGYCQVDFYDSVSAAACKDGMNGYVFNGRPCVVILLQSCYFFFFLVKSFMFFLLPGFQERLSLKETLQSIRFAILGVTAATYHHHWIHYFLFIWNDVPSQLERRTIKDRYDGEFRLVTIRTNTKFVVT